MGDDELLSGTNTELKFTTPLIFSHRLWHSVSSSANATDVLSEIVWMSDSSSVFESVRGSCPFWGNTAAKVFERVYIVVPAFLVSNF